MALPRARWEHFTLTFDHAALADVSLTAKLYKAPRRVQVLKVEYINPTGLVAHNDNHFTLSVKNGSTTVAGPRSTDADGGGSSIAADTFTDLDVVSPAVILAEGDILSFVAAEAGTATLPAGRLVIHCRYV